MNKPVFTRTELEAASIEDCMLAYAIAEKASEGITCEVPRSMEQFRRMWESDLVQFREREGDDTLKGYLINEVFEFQASYL